MKPDTVNQIISMIEAQFQSRPSAIEFEMAYQARVAMDRIRFAITATEESPLGREQLREAGLQLLDALDRLEAAERRFQQQFRRWAANDRPPSRAGAGQKHSEPSPWE